MQTYHEPARDIPILREVDVLVVGGGPAGIGAALAAARTGTPTLLLERHAFFGGVASYGMGMPINQMRPAGQARGAVHEMLIEHLKRFGPEAVNIVGHALVCNIEYLRVAVMDALDCAGCQYFLHTQVVDTLVEGNRVTGVVIATREGLATIKARVTVDATGDADVTFHAGAKTLKGRESDGFLSPMTLNFIISNIDVAQARAFASDGGLARVLEQARSKYPLLPASMHFELGPFPLQHALVINHAGTKLLGVLDGTNPGDITEAERFSRHQAVQIVAALREFAGPVFAHVQLAATGAQVGVRETRRIQGLYVLTEADAKTGQRFPDAVAWRSGFLDIGFVRYEEMQVHDVPYRALLPESIDGLLAAGRCISATHVAASAGKSMGNCMATGHAAGRAAALAVHDICQPRNISVSKLQQLLLDDEVPLATMQ